MTRYRRNKANTDHKAEPNFGITLSFEMITPDLAKKYLSSTHVAQRSLKRADVDRYVLDMKSGNWDEPPYVFDTIAFTPDGELVNGQHRLVAVVESGVAVLFMVLRGIHTKDRLPTGDMGRPRSGAFIWNIDDRSWQVARALCEIGYSWTGAPNTWIAPIAMALESGLAAVPYSKSKTFGTASCRAAFVWRYLHTESIEPSELLVQYHAIQNGDIDSMVPAIAALWKHFLLHPPARGGNGRRDVFVKTLYAIDNPSSRITCRNQETVSRQFIDDFRSVARMLGVQMEPTP